MAACLLAVASGTMCTCGYPGTSSLYDARRSARIVERWSLPAMTEPLACVMTQNENLDLVGALASCGEHDQMKDQTNDRVPNDKITAGSMAESAGRGSHK